MNWLNFAAQCFGLNIDQKCVNRTHFRFSCISWSMLMHWRFVVAMYQINTRVRPPNVHILTFSVKNGRLCSFETNPVQYNRCRRPQRPMAKNHKKIGPPITRRYRNTNLNVRGQRTRRISARLHWNALFGSIQVVFWFQLRNPKNPANELRPPPVLLRIRDPRDFTEEPQMPVHPWRMLPTRSPCPEVSQTHAGMEANHRQVRYDETAE